MCGISHRGLFICLFTIYQIIFYEHSFLKKLLFLSFRLLLVKYILQVYWPFPSGFQQIDFF